MLTVSSILDCGETGTPKALQLTRGWALHVIMDKERNPEFHSISSALVWSKRNYWKLGGTMLGSSVAIFIGNVLRLEAYSGKACFQYAVEAVAAFILFHVAMILAICFLGPLIDLLRGKRTRI